MTIQAIAIIGTGVMGMGIAQIAAQAGIQVRLFDTQIGAAEHGRLKLADTLQKLQIKGKISEQQRLETLNKVIVLDTLDEVIGVDIVVEAIIEDLVVKQNLFKQLEQIVSNNTILATNTSSLSVTAIASDLKFPQRLAGFHFFNPVPLMKIVEIIAGLNTSEDVITTLISFASKMGHKGVRTKDTPGFIVNHAGRAFGTEALKIYSESVASFAEIDRILRDGAGFRMGPFELLDLTGIDVSHPVMESIFNQYYQEDRYRPNVLTKQMLSAKRFGRKVGKGFYQYDEGVKTDELATQSIPKVNQFNQVWIGADRAEDADILKNYIQEQDLTLDQNQKPLTDSLILLATYGEDTTTAALRLQVDPKRSVNIDMLSSFKKHRTLMPSILTAPSYTQQAHALMALTGQGVSVIGESIGFVVQRVIAMIVNLACDIAQQSIASVEDIDQAVKLGLGYPYGPISWGDILGSDRILFILERIYKNTGDQRYRPSPWLQRRAALQISLFYTPSH